MSLITLERDYIEIHLREKPTKQEREAEIEADVEAAKGKKLKKKTKGRNKPGKRVQKKQEAVARVKRPYLEQKIQEEESISRKKQKTREGVELPKSLQRFVRKKASS